MRKNELVQILAETNHLSPGQAADELDDVVHSILLKLRKGKRAALPGLGKIVPGRPARFRPARRRGRR